MTLVLYTPASYLPVTRGTDAQANAALYDWLHARYLAGGVAPTPCVLTAVVLPSMEYDGRAIPSVVALVDADLVVEVLQPRRPLRIVRPE